MSGTADERAARLRECAEARVEAEQAERRLREAAVAARQAGCEITQIARACGVGRQTAYRWCDGYTLPRDR